MDTNVFEYLNFSTERKFEYFLETSSKIVFTPNYWFNFENVYINISKYDSPELYALDWLIGKTESELDEYFTNNPDSIKLIPFLLGIRNDKFLKGTKILEVQSHEGLVNLDFDSIDMELIPEYLWFIRSSGLCLMLRNGIRKSVHDYAIGVEAGMDSNGRKNRSGKRAELFLETVLNEISIDDNIISSGQITGKGVFDKYNIELDETFANRRFDGSLYNVRKRKLFLIEINNFNSSGSKSKASGTEFKDLKSRLDRTNHEFIYITDGDGWLSDKSHLKEVLEHIGKVFNFKMIEDGYLTDYIDN